MYADMEKTIFFKQICFEPKMFYPKKCVNYNKSNLQRCSVKCPKEPTNAKKSNRKCKNVPKKMPPRSAKLQQYSLFSTKQRNICNDFTPDRIFLLKYCMYVVLTRLETSDFINLGSSLLFQINQGKNISSAFKAIVKIVKSFLTR